VTVQNRIVGHGEEDPTQLLANPQNFRRHNGKQLDALRGSLKIGWVKTVIVNKHTGHVVDGHARVEEAMRQNLATIPVTYIDLSEAEERLMLASLDPISEMAYTDEKALESLLADVPVPQGDDLDAVAVRDLIERLRANAGLGGLGADAFLPRRVRIDALKEHPRNYRKHPEDQLKQIMASIEAHGFYRNVVVAKDNTILAGHGIVLAAKKLGKTRVPVIKLDIAADDPRALKVLTSDNEISRLAETDDRALTELLKEILSSATDGLLGTGFNEEQLAALAMVTRPASEMKNMDAAAEWLGMPEYEEGGTPIKLVISFLSEADRDRFVALHEIKLDKSAIKGTTCSTRWPWTDREDGASIKFDAPEGFQEVAASEPQPEDEVPPEEEAPEVPPPAATKGKRSKKPS
jgi:ParB-like chromosome segregation protein Spo0J